MVPIIIASYPENGSTDTALNSPIRITFADSIAPTTVNSDNIKLENLNDSRNIPLTFSYNADTFEATITPADNAYGNMLLGLVSYRLSISNISSPIGEVMQGLHTLDFLTVSDSVEDVIEEPGTFVDEFSIVNLYPKKDSYSITPQVIKVKLNKAPLESSVNTDTFIVTTDTITDLSDIGFVDISKVEGQCSILAGNIIQFTPTAALSDNTVYTVILTGIRHAATDGEEVLATTMYSFYSKVTPLYATLQDIASTYRSISSLIKSVDPIEIIHLINENSELAYWTAEQTTNQDNIVWNPPERAVIEFVKTKTRYDIVFDKYVQLSTEASAKTLADLTVEYNTSLADLLTLANKLKMEYEFWANILKGSKSGKVTPKPFRKGEDIDEDPDFMNRQFKDWEGTKSWQT